jgi:peptidyl-prolyl cis-trans isomerase C
MHVWPLRLRSDDRLSRVTRPWQRWLREPLLHFLLAGAVLFGAYGLLRPLTPSHEQPRRIELTRDDLRQLAVAWLAQGRGTPTPQEMAGLVNQKVTEEILAREATALGLDRDDEIIKRRLAQKMDFLAEDVAALYDPTAAELRIWFTQHPDRFALPPRVTFHHLYFSPDRRGADARGAAEAALRQLADQPAHAPSAANLSDPFMFQDAYSDRAPDSLAKEFGPQFVRALFALTPSSWQGPIESGYGWHLVWIDALDPGRIPAFEEVEPDVKADWLDDRRREMKRQAFEAMRARYTIVVPPIDAADLANLPPQQATVPSSALYRQ